MERAGKIAFWGAWGTLGGLGLVAAIWFLMPILVNSTPIRTLIRFQASIHIPVEFDFDELKIGVLPAPHLTIVGGRLSIPGQLTAGITAIAIYPDILPLLIGRISIDAISIQSPTVNLQMPAARPETMTPSVSPGEQAVALLTAIGQKLRPGRFTVDNGRLTLQRADRPVVQMESMDGSLSRDDERIQLDATARAGFAAMLRVQAGIQLHSPAAGGRIPRVQVAVQGRDVDVAALRDSTQLLIGQPPAFFTIVQGGKLPEIYLTSSGTSLPDLVKHLRVTAQAADGRILVPDLKLDLTAVAGVLSVADGTLTLQQASARLGKTSGRNGRLTLGLNRHPMPLDLTTDLDADLSQVPPLLGKVIKNEPVLGEIQRIRKMDDRAKGSLSLAGDLHQLRVQVSAGSITLAVDYDRLPFPVTLTGEGFDYTAGRIALRNIRGHMQHTDVDLVSGELTWHNAPHLDLHIAGATLAAAEILPWLMERPGPWRTWQSLEGISGRIMLTDATVNGPLATPRHWQIKGKGSLSDLVIASRALPADLSLKKADFSIEPQRMELSASDVRLSDATLSVNAAIHNYSNAEPEFEVRSLTGVMGSRAVQWACNRLNLRDSFQLQAPFTIAAAGGTWSRPAGLQLKGDLAWPGDLGVSAALTYANGQLEADEVLVTSPVWGLVSIHAVALDAHDTELNVTSMDVSWREQRLQLTGKAYFHKEGVQLDMAVSAGALDMGVIEDALQSVLPDAAPAVGAPSTQGTAIRGKIAVDVGWLSYGSYLVQPLKADLNLTGDSRVVIDVTEAGLCGLATAGQAEWTPRGLRVDISPRAEQKRLQFTSSCLTGEPSTERLEGTADIRGQLTTHGRNREELSNSVQGLVQVNLQDGRVFNVGTTGFFTNLLSFLNLSNLLSGAAPHFSTRDFPYTSISARLTFKEGSIELTDGKLFSDALNMVAEGTIHPLSGKLNLTVLVSPLTTIDTIVRHIPILGKILQGTLVAVPVGVSGSVSDPTIFPLSPKAVGSRLVGILEGILKAPFQLVEPILPFPGGEHTLENDSEPKKVKP